VRDSDDPQRRPDEQCIALTRDYRLIQKVRGHRYSVDDMLVAHLAGTQAISPRRVLDLGSGLGSVLLITAWTFPTASLVGMEVLAEHVTFARRNILLNDCQDRARIVEGDLRDIALVASLGCFDLVTGSPPYFDPRSGTHCSDPARAAAHFEINGGIEDYARAASQALNSHGQFVTCAGADPPQRAMEALQRAGLTLSYHQTVIPRVGKKPFLTLLVGTKDSAAVRSEAPPLVLRQQDGQRTPQHLAIREWTGIPCRRITESLEVIATEED
jgi:tRNA1Val (adenine37-N6)-methyltransferase